MNWSQWSMYWNIPEDRAPSCANKLRYELAKAFGIRLSFSDLMHPRSAGMNLLGETGVDLTPLPEDLQRLITNTSPQHRIELFPRSGLLNALYLYDGRAMYLGCCSKLGVAGGRYTDVTGQDIYDPDRGRALVEFWPPKGWVQPGILAVKQIGGDGWIWPTDPCPWQTWADLSEIRMARRNGWRVRVLRKIVWPESAPLDRWAGTLSRLYLKSKGTKNDDLARCYRSICLYTIGGMHNLGYQDRVQEVPVDDRQVRLDNIVSVVDGRTVAIKQRTAIDKDPFLCHPEWSAAIWARARGRITRAMLSLPPDTVHAVYGDCIYTSAAAVPDAKGEPFFDDGAVGRLRLSRIVTGPLPAPQNWRSVRLIVEAGEVRSGCPKA